MKTLRRLQRPLSLLLLPLLLLTFTGPGYAALVGTGEAIAAAQGTPERQQLLDLLARDDVRAHLIASGIDPVLAEQRVNALSDAELQSLASRYPDLPAGGDSLIGALVFVFVVLLVTDILGFTDVFPFVKKTVN